MGHEEGDKSYFKQRWSQKVMAVKGHWSKALKEERGSAMWISGEELFQHKEREGHWNKMEEGSTDGDESEGKMRQADGTSPCSSPLGLLQHNTSVGGFNRRNRFFSQFCRPHVQRHQH